MHSIQKGLLFYSSLALRSGYNFTGEACESARKELVLYCMHSLAISGLNLEEAVSVGRRAVNTPHTGLSDVAATRMDFHDHMLLRECVQIAAKMNN